MVQKRIDGLKSLCMAGTVGPFAFNPFEMGHCTHIPTASIESILIKNSVRVGTISEQLS